MMILPMQIPEFFLCAEVSKIALVFVIYHLGLIGFIPTGWFDPIFGFTMSVKEGKGTFSQWTVVVGHNSNAYLGIEG